jgi:HD superfamily phosphodiesterase
MKFCSASTIVNAAFNFVIFTSKKYNIDESHSLKHSIDVFNFANKIYNSEVRKSPFLQEQKDIIHVSAILHDMCDKKYMNEGDGVVNINKYMETYMPQTELKVVSDIISTMSYSKVRKSGYPNLGEYQLAYNIVREADLLSAYDVDRCLIYQLMHENYTYSDSLKLVYDLFENRVLKYREDKLFITNYSKSKSYDLHTKALEDIAEMKKIQL